MDFDQLPGIGLISIGLISGILLFAVIKLVITNFRALQEYRLKKDTFIGFRLSPLKDFQEIETVP